jgi:glycosyltransferase involved in cell wall biosynthesis
MKILWLASLLPTTFSRVVAPWNVENIQALTLWGGAEVKAVCPIRLTPPEALVFRFPPDLTQLKQWYTARQSAPSHRSYENIDITYLKWHGLPKRLFWGLEGRSMFSQLQNSLTKIISAFHPEVIYAPWLNPEGVTGCLLGSRLGIPCVVQGQGSDVNFDLRRHPWRGLFIHDIQKAAALLFACHALKNTATHLGLIHQNQQVVYNGVDIDTFKPAPERCSNKRKTIITIAGMNPVKNLSLLLNAFGRLPSHLQDATELVFVGDGSCRRSLEEQARGLGVQSKVRFAGHVIHSDVVNYLQQADVFCLSSFSEGFPLATLEAMACGLPVVATNVGGVSEAFVDGITGLLVESDNVDVYASALHGALTRLWDPVAIRDVVVKNFTHKRYAENMMGIFRDVCS